MNPNQRFQGSILYGQMLQSFTHYHKIIVDLDSNEISKAIFVDLARIKFAEWITKLKFNRKKRHTLSELFQDIIAYYLKCCLSDQYEIELEKKINKTQVDIAIKHHGKYSFLIEIKTNLGYERPDFNLPDPYINIKNRIFELSKNFDVHRENIIYILETV